jgi:ribosomal protein S18 acetylase RimI-like enzyme
VVISVVTVRRAEERDLDSFEALSSAQHALWCREQFLRSDVVMLVAVDDRDVPVGKLHVEFARPGTARVVAASVATTLQSQGIGTRLMAAAERLACEAGAQEIELGAEDGNPRARQLYERLGYEVVRTDDFKYEGAPVPNPGVWMRKDVRC